MIKPINGNILLEPIEREVKSKSKLLFSGETTLEEDLKYGVIIDGGSSKYKKGTKIFYSKYSAVCVFSNDLKTEYRLLNENDIMAIEE